MQRNEIPFTEAENAILQNHTFLPLKQRAMDNIVSLMAALREGIDQVWEGHGQNWTIPCPPDSVKISKGENYRQLPYVILDYPRKFARDDVFAFRSMFWWGHFFSYTLHIQGHTLEKLRPMLLEKLPNNKDRYGDVHLCVASTPWQYHYGPHNYQLLQHLSTDAIETLLKTHDFVKLSGWRPVSAPQAEVIKAGRHYFKQFMELLFDTESFLSSNRPL